jgi:hypothetical protein
LQEHQQELLPPLPQKGTREYRAKNEAKREESRAVLRRNSSGSTCLVAADAKNNSILAKTQDLSQLLLLFPSHAVSLNLVHYHSGFAAADQPFLAHPRSQLLQITNPFATNICREDSAGIHYCNSSNKKFQLPKNLLVLLLPLLHLCRTQAPFPPHPAQSRDDHIASKYPYHRRLRERKQTTKKETPNLKHSLPFRPTPPQYPTQPTRVWDP